MAELALAPPAPINRREGDVTGRANALTIHLMGGLGNQLFQYAFGRRLALANSADLYLDATGYPTTPEADPAKGLRTCELQEFNIVGTVIGLHADMAPPDRTLARLWGKGCRAIGRVADKRKPYYARQEITEPAVNSFRYDHRVLDRPIRGSVHARGFWQSEKYFADVESQLRSELTLRHDLDPTSRGIVSEIASSISVGVHVRHGDNASEVAGSVGVLTKDYYDSALAALKKELKDLQFFVFSDNIPWARALLDNLVKARYVDHNGLARSYADLWLVSQCKHHVLANSTFGWWGAWLGRKPGQIVYAPRRYYQYMDRPNPDLYPPDWRLI
jgi:hypothetical protein